MAEEATLTALPATTNKYKPGRVNKPKKIEKNKERREKAGRVQK
jgi:hypothetical protein